MNSGFLSRVRRSARRAGIGLAFLTFTLPTSLSAQQGFATLEEQMTGDQFKAAGLEKLSPQELATLNRWIRDRSLATLATPHGATTVSSADDAVATVNTPSIEEMPRETITTRISGNFSGWDGQTVFKLENGMIWAQTDKDKFYTQEMQNPLVTIEPGMFGAWKLSIEGHDDECKVQRIQ